MSWLDSQDDALLKAWLRNTKSPMMATLPDGEILWVNQSYESMLGFTSYELVGERTWKDLTYNKDDLSADEKLALDVVRGDRIDYQVEKEFKTKSGPPKRVVLNVLRYPLQGDFKCFLTSVMPMDSCYEHMVGEITSIKGTLLSIMEHQTQLTGGVKFSDIKSFVVGNKVISVFLGLLLLYLLFGDKVMDVYDRIYGKNSTVIIHVDDTMDIDELVKKSREK